MIRAPRRGVEQSAFRCAVTVCLALGWVLPFAGRLRGEETPLDHYVATPDAVYEWNHVDTVGGDGYQTHVLWLTSQQWRNATEVQRPVWTHWLTIVVPEETKHRTAMLWIGGGSHETPQPKNASERAVRIALETRSVVAELSNVPNQPLTILDGTGRAREEDDLIAASRHHFIATGDPKWLVRLAMVKSGVRAMDAVQDFLLTERGGGVVVDNFVVAGGSKRGWTTWLVAVVDPRVSAIIPLVIDALNSQAITRHHFEAHGFFSNALNNYVEHGLFPRRLGTSEYGAALAIEDPYHYRGRDRLKIPKFLVNASGDEFFLPDNAQFYFHEMPEEKHLRYVPNAKHNLEGSDAVESVIAFYQSVLDNRPRPQFGWQHDEPGVLRVSTLVPPSAVRLWQATNPKARDFRLDTLGKAYRSSDVEEVVKGNEYVARVATPAAGYAAYFVEMEFASGGRYPLKFSTEVRVVPDTLPYKLPAWVK